MNGDDQPEHTKAITLGHQPIAPWRWFVHRYQHEAHWLAPAPWHDCLLRLACFQLSQNPTPKPFVTYIYILYITRGVHSRKPMILHIPPYVCKIYKFPYFCSFCLFWLPLLWPWRIMHNMYWTPRAVYCICWTSMSSVKENLWLVTRVCIGPSLVTHLEHCAKFC